MKITLKTVCIVTQLTRFRYSTLPEKWTKAFRQSYLMNRPLLQDLYLVKYFRLLTLNDISAN